MANEYKICIETFIRWEQLTGRSFQSINFENEDDLHRLLYCAYWVETGCITSYDTFAKTMKANPKQFRKALNNLTRYNSLTQQFSGLAPEAHEQTAEDTEMTGHLSLISDVATRLIIVGGMDARYVMREMTINDMLLFVRALDDKQRQESESQRLWTYLSMLPHVDGKKLDTPQKLVTFPWEVEERKQELKRVKEELYAEFESFMRGDTPVTSTENAE